MTAPFPRSRRRQGSWLGTRGTPTAGRMVGGSALTLGSRITGAVLGFASTVLAARILGPSGFGLYSLALSIVSLLAVIGTLGLGDALVQRVPLRLKQGGTAAASTLSSAVRASMVLSLFLAAVVELFGHELSSLLGQPGAYPYVAITSLAVPLAALLNISRAANQAVFEFGGAVLPDGLIRPVTLVLGLSVVLLLGSYSWTVPISYVASYLVASTAGWWWVARTAAYTRHSPGRTQPRRDSGALGRNSVARGMDSTAWRALARLGSSGDSALLPLAFTFMVMTLLGTFSQSATTMVMGRMASSAAVGFFSVALRLATLVGFLLVALNMTFAPLISTLWAEGAVERLRNLYIRSTKWLLIASTPLCLVLIVEGKWMLSLFGPGFQPASLPLAILAAGQLINAGTGSVGYMLAMTGHEQWMVRFQVAQLAVVVVMSVAFVPFWGATGAAVAFSSALGVLNLAALYKVRRLIGAFPYSRETLGVVAAGVVAGSAGVAISPLVSGFGWVTALVEVAALMMVVYLPLIYVLAVSDNDRSLLRGFLSSMRKQAAS